MGARWSWHERVVRRGVRFELMPRAAVAAAEGAELGAYERTFGKLGRPTRVGFKDVLAAFCICTSLFSGWGSWTSIFLCAGVALLVISFGWRVMAGDDNAHLRVYLFEGGVVCRDHSANFAAFQWTDIQVDGTVTRGHHEFGQEVEISYTIIGSNGYRLALPPAEFESGELAVVGAALQRAVSTVQLPDAEA